MNNSFKVSLYGRMTTFMVISHFRSGQQFATYIGDNSQY
jgi:hypothetical protein